MNTKAYLKLFKYSLEAGDLPQELYDRITSEICAEGKLTPRIYNLYLEELEKRRLFLTDGAPFDTKNSARTDGTYVYKHEKNPFWHISHALAAGAFKFIGWLGSGLVYGMWHFPRKYAKKFKGIGACVTVCNHVGYIDSCLVRRALGVRKQNIIAAPHNCKNNFGGALLRAATVVPLPSSLRGVKPFNEMLEYLRDRKSALHFYAEKSMWLGYKKPRPYMEGAFYYADRLDVPVVPMLICFGKPRGLRKLLGLPRAEIRVGDPLYADKSLGRNARKTDLCERTFESVKRIYEEFYGIPLEYLDQGGEESGGGENSLPADKNADMVENG